MNTPESGKGIDVLTFSEIAAEIFDEGSRLELRKLFLTGDIESAKGNLLIGIDKAFEAGRVSCARAAEMYYLLDIPTEYACVLRQERAKFEEERKAEAAWERREKN